METVQKNVLYRTRSVPYRARNLSYRKNRMSCDKPTAGVVVRFRVCV